MRKAERILAAVDWIFLPAGVRGGAGFARRIVEPLGLPPGKFRPVTLCMSRAAAADQEAYRRAADEIAAELRRGQSAAWITEGDPLFYSTFLHLYEELRRRCPEVRIEIVPGVTSPSAAAARAGLCRRPGWMNKVAVVPAAYGIERLPALLDDFTTVFLLKVNGVFDRCWTALASRAAVGGGRLCRARRHAGGACRRRPGIAARPGLAVLRAGDPATRGGRRERREVSSWSAWGPATARP